MRFYYLQVPHVAVLRTQGCDLVGYGSQVISDINNFPNYGD